MGGTSSDRQCRGIMSSSSSNHGAAKSPKVSGVSRATTDQGEDGGTREPSGAIRMIVPCGAKRGRSQDGADWSTDYGNVMGLVV